MNKTNIISHWRRPFQHHAMAGLLSLNANQLWSAAFTPLDQPCAVGFRSGLNAALQFRTPMRNSLTLAILTLCLLGGLLTVRGQDPYITLTNYPLNANASSGATVSFRVFANSTNPPMTYQWQHEGTNLLAATNAILVMTNLTVAHAGGYMAWITNASGGFTNTRTAMLTVDPTFTQITTGPLVTDTLGGWCSSWIDYDGDGKLDVCIAPKGDRLEATRIYHNEGDGTFRRVTTNAISQTAVRSWTHVWADYNNDGNPDLFVPNTQGMNDMLFHNNGNGSFTRITTGHPVIDAASAGIGVWADYNRDGFLDLFVNGDCPSLYRSNGDMTFRKMTLAEVGPILSCLASDYAVWADVDNDGWPELYMDAVPPNQPAGWSMTNHVYHLDSQGKFYLMDIGELKKGKEGYTSIIWADYDNDGLPDALAGVERGLFGLYRNLAGQGFTNVAASAFSSPLTNATWGFAVDYDNDGWQDVVVGFWDWQNRPVSLFRNNGDGSFTRQLVGGPTSLVGGSLYWGDYNNDGFLDLLVNYNPGIRNSLFQHNGNINHWLKVKLDGRASNRSGIGAKVRVNAIIGGRSFWQMREISGQGSYNADNGLIAHFGLGDATNVTTLRIEWPSGIVQVVTNVAANQFLTVVESQGYAGAPPEFSDVTNGSDAAQLSFTEPLAGSRYILEASTNLVTWTKLMARTSAGSTAQFTDTGATNYTRRFYRLQLP
jgi:hypothetical protein